MFLNNSRIRLIYNQIFRKHLHRKICLLFASSPASIPQVLQKIIGKRILNKFPLSGINLQLYTQIVRTGSFLNFSTNLQCLFGQSSHYPTLTMHCYMLIIPLVPTKGTFKKHSFHTHEFAYSPLKSQIKFTNSHGHQIYP